MSTSVKPDDRIVELLVQRATEGLGAADQIELKRLLAQGSHADIERFESTAAALTLGALDDESLPNSLRDRLYQQADSFASKSSTASVAAFEPKTKTNTSHPVATMLGWFAAAACAVLAIAGWWPRLQEGRGEIEVLAQPSADLETIKKAREKLLAQSSVLQREWKATEDPAAHGVTGDIVWDAQSQVGYMRFRGLPTNNPQQLQYQLWIFDTTRGDQYPVDGGVFDIPATTTGEVVVPILAKLPIRDPALFAVTIEKPGGAVVSSRERIVVVAPIAAG